MESVDNSNGIHKDMHCVYYICCRPDSPWSISPPCRAGKPSRLRGSRCRQCPLGHWDESSEQPKDPKPRNPTHTQWPHVGPHASAVAVHVYICMSPMCAPAAAALGRVSQATHALPVVLKYFSLSTSWTASVLSEMCSPGEGIRRE